MSLETSVKNDRRRAHVASGDAQGEFRFRRLLEGLPAGAYTCDAAGLITYFNPQAVELWGRTPKLNHSDDRFCGSFKLFSADGSPIRHDQCWMALALRGSKEYNGYEMLIERPDGNRVTVLAHANPFLDDSGNLLGAVNVLVDITARKRAEESLRDAHDELAHKVVERTAELTELSHHLMEAAEEERAKLAGELHDEMGSLLTVLSMRLGRLGVRLPATAPDLLAEHEQLIDLVRSMVASQRRLVENLRPLLLDSFGLGVALNRYVEDWSRNTGIPADVAIAPPHAQTVGRRRAGALSDCAGVARQYCKIREWHPGANPGKQRARARYALGRGRRCRYSTGRRIAHFVTRHTRHARAPAGIRRAAPRGAGGRRNGHSRARDHARVEGRRWVVCYNSADAPVAQLD